MLFRKHEVCNRLLTESCNMTHSSHLSAGDETTEQGPVSGLCLHLSCAAPKASSLSCTVPPVFAGAPNGFPSATVWAWFLHTALARWFDKSEKSRSQLNPLRSLLFPPLLCSAFLSLSHCLSPFPLHPYPSLLPFFPYLVFVVKIFPLPHPGCRRVFMWGVDSSS